NRGSERGHGGFCRKAPRPVQKSLTISTNPAESARYALPQPSSRGSPRHRGDPEISARLVDSGLLRPSASQRQKPFCQCGDSSVSNQAHFQVGTAAFESAGSITWPDGAVCPHRRIRKKVHVLKGARTKKDENRPEGIERHRLKKSRSCPKPFTVWIGPVFEA